VVGGQSHAPAALAPAKTRYPLYRRLGGPQGRVWTGRKISPPTGLLSPDRPALSESLYRLSYPAPPPLILQMLNLGRYTVEFLLWICYVTHCSENTVITYEVQSNISQLGDIRSTAVLTLFYQPTRGGEINYCSQFRLGAGRGSGYVSLVVC
jgi:hypothetical protein